MEFHRFPKIPRYDREVIITEKIDGTNAQIYIGCGHDDLPDAKPIADWDDWGIWAGSRSKWLSEKDDNHGFAKWVACNATCLIAHLGPGLHYGEWWGQGVQRKYGLDHKRFSLFNVIRWNPDMWHRYKVLPWLKSLDAAGKPRRGAPPQPKPWTAPPECCDVVPVLGVEPFVTFRPHLYIADLAIMGSKAAPGYNKPEGIVIYHTQGNLSFKVTIDEDGGKHGNQ